MVAVAVSGAATVNEGAPYTLTLSATGPGAGAVTGWTIRWGDGSSDTLPGGATSATHTYATNEVFTLSASATLDDGSVAPAGSLDVQVVNLPPTIRAVTNSPVAQGTSATVSVIADDPGVNDTLTYDFDFNNDGQYEVSSSSGTVQHLFSDVGTFPVNVRVRDADSAAAMASTLVTVNNLPPTIQAVNLLTQMPEEASPVAMQVIATDPGGADDPLTYDFDFDHDGTYEVSGDANVAEHVFADNGNYTVGVRVRDGHGGAAVGSIQVAVANVAPFVTPPSFDGRADEGSPVTVTVRASDPAGVNDPLTYQFDFDNDGVYEVTSLTGVATHTFPDDGTYVVGVRVLDDDGGVTVTRTTILVHNVEPTIDLAGADTVAAGSVYTLTLGAVHDPGQDTVVQYIVQWGDGTQDVYTQPGNVTHVYSNVFGPKTIRVALVDEDGTHPLAGQRTVLVTGAGILGDTLWVIGTNGDDHVVINEQGNGLIKVHASFFVGTEFVTIPTAQVRRIAVYLNGGNDDATVAGDVTIPVILDGGDGNDRLKAGGGPAVLIGGAGDDTLTGSGGRNILIGGLGADTITDGQGEDILIGGRTVYDSDPAALAALDAILAEWNSSRDYATRIANLRGTGSGAGFDARLNGNFFLRADGPNPTVFDDGAQDVMTGGGGLDWFFANLDSGVLDHILDLGAGEVVDHLKP
ncbi:MAG: PKD domain-containing protein [Acidobacteria bacterium]|nr:PKD domain-containing protein [Acidobacteriota bacterium]